ncbi:MAG: hypothetical protein IPG59_15635 [Candidatus Melainabacteria bacterium]|nr:MAG: hypothetical protein IPG59_15635 [Candidatus Melainabacteria bacterium]
MRNNCRLMNFTLGASLALSFLLSINTGEAQAKKKSVSKGNDYPRLVSGANTAEGKIALEIAKAAFKANTPRVWESGDEVKDKVKSVILCQNSQVEAWHKEGAIDTIKDKDDFSFIYIQKNKFNKNRFVVTQYNHSWRGDIRALVRVPDNLSQDEILSVIHRGGTPEPADKKGSQELFNDSWSSPWIAEKDGVTCGIDTGHPAGPLGDWIVYGMNEKTDPIATIAFHPQVTDTTSLIPKGPLNDIARLLDSIVGTPKADQGTLNPSGRIHADVKYLWMDLIYRPWSMGTAYNTRTNIERNLIKWSKGSKVYKAQYDKLKVLYPQAETQLAQHYKTRFGWGDAKCKEASKLWMDAIYRAHFVFPSDG